MRSIAFLLMLLAPVVAQAGERQQVFSLQGLDCASCVDEIKSSLQVVKGFHKLTFDRRKVEMTVWLDGTASNDAVLAAVDRAGFKASVGPGQGAWLVAGEPWPETADVKYLTRDGSAVGKLEKHRVPGKFTVFDVYADWCGPCKDVDAQLRKIVASRADVAVRKLNIVDFDSPLGQEFGDQIEGLPYVVVFSPAGKKTVLTGANPQKLEKALAK